MLLFRSRASLVEKSGSGPYNRPPSGEVPERSIGAVSKTVVRFCVPWVRIPPSPPSMRRKPLIFATCERQRRDPADATTCAGDEGHLASKGRFLISHGFHPPRLSSVRSCQAATLSRSATRLGAASPRRLSTEASGAHLPLRAAAEAARDPK